ncbi:MAG: hypothetical protein M1828_003166 [Chrysothrix sp. TS-e1954]|nr:MAG: hypothetical protein M1828_003166 [Chrysothrix sp. TS-e1954]
MRLEALSAIFLLVTVASTAALPTNTSHVSERVTSTYGSLGHGVYQHFLAANGTMYFVYHGNPRRPTLSERSFSDLTPNDDDPKDCKHQLTHPNAGAFGPWCETPNSKDPWKCATNGQEIDTYELVNAYGVMRNALAKGTKWSTSTAISATFGSAVAFVCKFGDSLTYSEKHFAWMMREIDTNCHQRNGASYYDGKKYTVGRTVTTDTCSCAFKGTGNACNKKA